ncbi:MAG TPA: Gfo/Idh/MocA family oxidoreductase [Chthonomonadaceae bacterium]|nr:Gfo/Idh/MocA family oxidoreductase [Chthonomonadaceae bacterium]
MANETQSASATRDPDSQEAVRIGVVGAGWFASRRHLPDAQQNPRVTIAALCRRDPEARAKMAARFGVPPERAYEDWRRMLDEAELDAVLIATPNALHYEQAQAALERGLHVLVEKPMAVRSAEAWELVALARAKDRKLAVALNPPFWAHCHRIRRALRDPRMGSLENASLYFTSSAEYVFGRAPLPADLPGVVPPTLFRADPELTGGGYFIDGGSHLVSELLWVTGLRARRVCALMDTTPTDMRACVSLELDNGVVAAINTIGDSKYARRRVRNVFGTTNGMITVNTYDFETQIVMTDQETQTFREGDIFPVANPITNFVDAIQGRGALFSPGEHGAQVVEVVEAAYRSAETGQTITLQESGTPPTETAPVPTS